MIGRPLFRGIGIGRFSSSKGEVSADVDEEEEACAWTVEVAEPFIVDKFIAVDMVSVEEESLLLWLIDAFSCVVAGAARKTVRRGLRLVVLSNADVDWVIRLDFVETSVIDCIVDVVKTWWLALLSPVVSSEVSPESSLVLLLDSIQGKIP